MQYLSWQNQAKFFLARLVVHLSVSEWLFIYLFNYKKNVMEAFCADNPHIDKIVISFAYGNIYIT